MFAVDPIKHSCKPLGGMIRDVKNLGKRYLSDFRDCLSWQVFISIIFLYIAFIAPAIAFGGLMEEVTLDLIGETETLLATGLCGVVFGLFSVQPLAVLAFTGPLLLFEEIIHEVCGCSIGRECVYLLYVYMCRYMYVHVLYMFLELLLVR